MTSQRAAAIRRSSLQDLREMLRKRNIRLADGPATPPPDTTQALSEHQEAELFAQAMSGVTPLSHNLHWKLPRERLSFVQTGDAEEDEVVAALQRLIDSGQGFNVSQTSEYMEATGPGVGPEIARRLHEGNYAIQDHIDLHGFYVEEAEQQLTAFIQRCLAQGFRAVLIVHGRGLKSAGKPVLKLKVFQWLTKGPFRGHVIALASARTCDGGCGATYVLLRQRPLTKSRRRARG